MRRSFIFLSVAHLLLGLVAVGSGVGWILLHYFDERFGDDRLPSYAYLVMLPSIISGSLIFIGGCFGFCFNKKSSCSARLYVISNVFNIIVWTPLLMVGYSILVIVMNGRETTYCGVELCIPASWSTYDLHYLRPDGLSWVFLFPGIGIGVGFLDFFISISALLTYCCMSSRSKHSVDT